jgi:predicted CoA-binding protein
MAKKFKDAKLGYAGMRDITGILRLKKVEEGKEVKEEKNGYLITKVNNGLYTEVIKEKDGSVISHNYTMSLPIDVNGSIVNLFINGENISKDTKKFIMIGSGADLKKLWVNIAEAEEYAKDANNSMRIWLDGEEHRFVTNIGLIQWIIDNRDILNNRVFKIVTDSRINVWNGNTSIRGDIKSMSTDKYGQQIVDEIERKEANGENASELKEKIIGNNSGSIPLYIAKDMFKDVTFKNRKTAFLKVRGVMGVKTGKQDDNGKDIWEDKLVPVENFFQLPKQVMDIDDEDKFEMVLKAMKTWCMKPKMVMASYQVLKGDEPQKVELDEGTKAILSVMSTEKEQQTYLKTINKSTGNIMRGYAKETYHIISVNPFEDDIVVTEDDFYNFEEVQTPTKTVNANDLKNINAKPSISIKI